MEEQLSMFQLNPDGIIVPVDGTDVTLRGNAQVALSNILLNGQFRFNYIEWRLFFAMLSCIEETDKEFKLYNIRVQDIIDLADLKSGSHLYEEIDNNIMSLMSHVVKWENADDPGNPCYAQLVHRAKYFRKQGIVQLQPHPDMKPHLLQLRKEFTQAQLKQCIKFNNPYTSRLYMLLKQFDSPKSGCRTMSIAELRYKLTLDYTEKIGKKEVPYSIYPNYADMKRWILVPAQQEIAKTDIPFEFTPLKTGRKVTAIKFTLKGGRKLLPTPLVPQQDDLSEEQARAWGRMRKFRFTDHQIRKVLQSGSLEDIHRTCYDIETTDWNTVGQAIKNKSAYAYGIFKKKFGLD